MLVSDAICSCYCFEVDNRAMQEDRIGFVLGCCLLTSVGTLHKAIYLIIQACVPDMSSCLHIHVPYCSIHNNLERTFGAHKS